jgi:protein phosphatase-4 regulatory subunit 3
MALAAPPVSDRRRVKVYELKNNDWFDRGTGFCTAVHTNVSRARHRHARPDIAQEESRIQVQSEEDPARMLLETKVTRDDGYQKQQGIISAPSRPR